MPRPRNLRPHIPPPTIWPVTWLQRGGWRFYAAWPILAVVMWLVIGLLSCGYDVIMLGQPPCRWLLAELGEAG